MKAKIINLKPTKKQGTLATINIDIPPTELEELYSAEAIDISMKVYKGKKSQGQNKLLWEMLTRLAIKLQTDKVELYKDFVRKYGISEQMVIKDEAIESFSKVWSKNGLAWFVDIIDKSKEHQGFTWVSAYYGTSEYDKAQMSRLISQVFDECKTQGIPTISNDELKAYGIEIDEKPQEETNGKLTSIFTKNLDECIFTGSHDVERHHVFANGRRNHSTKYGYVVPLVCWLHPNGARFDDKKCFKQLGVDRKGLDLWLKRTCQTHFESEVGTREEFIEIFGKSYLDDDQGQVEIEF